MTRILIVEGNSPSLLARGAAPAAQPFVRALGALAPDIVLHHAAPHLRPLTDADLDTDAVVFTGSGDSWAADAPQAAPQRAAMRAAFDAGLPVWGSCNGLQLAAVLLGGAVAASPNGLEAGFARDIRIKASHPMLAGRRDGYAAPCIHRDVVQRTPSGAQVLAGNAHSPVQAMVYETGSLTVWGTQYHPECTAADIAAYLHQDGIYSENQPLAAQLLRADENPAVAGMLGATPHDMLATARSGELAAWLGHVTKTATAAPVRPTQ